MRHCSRGGRYNIIFAGAKCSNCTDDIFQNKNKSKHKPARSANPQTVFAISDDVGNDGELKGDLRERLDEMVRKQKHDIKNDHLCRKCVQFESPSRSK